MLATLTEFGKLKNNAHFRINGRWYFKWGDVGITEETDEAFAFPQRKVVLGRIAKKVPEV